MESGFCFGGSHYNKIINFKVDYHVHKWCILINCSSYDHWKQLKYTIGTSTINFGEATCIMKQFTDTPIMMIIFIEAVS